MSPFIFVGILAALFAATGDSRRKPQAPIPPSAVAAVLLWVVVGPALLYELGVLLAALRSGDWSAALIATVWTSLSLLILFPWPITRMVLIPTGRFRLAWLLSRLSLWMWRRDVRGGATVAACWAALRRSQAGVPLGPEDLAWLERRLEVSPRGTVRWKLGGAGIVAAGLLADARGDREGARRLFASAGELAQPTWPAQTIVTAWSWLCADAIERGAWREAEFLARTAPIETRTTNFIGSVAARLTGIAPIPNDLLLQWRWFAAPHRRDTLELLRRALAAPSSARIDDIDINDDADINDDDDIRDDASIRDDADIRDDDDEPSPRLEPCAPPLERALRLHARALSLRPEGLDRGQLIALAQAWDTALETPLLETVLHTRGAALGAHAAEQDPARVTELIRDDLLALIHDAGLELGPLRDSSELLGRAARRLHGELLDNLEVTITALESRVDQRRELPALAEWHEFLALREQYARAASVGGLQLRRLAFSTVHGPLCSLAVWLWNDRSERAIANAMFQWLLAEAVVVDDTKAVTLQEKNVACGV